ncbi:ferritin-like domain-containing protein [Roseinatronobacter sp. S2]|uniref:ferritin-like domain-containing protein n=1 Tax=Roseinatronobacter sp. S2 TaxID=3035471 RepID=UPI0024102E93|nr:ferritin-like domain-containing protein [Roseinatronobacter sp. S2]WFE76546.1 ferritin-like domain-containing protein [Roseinatronobacter sp. S2]
MSDARKYVDQWLRDAHAMEKQAESILEGQVSRIKNYPELAERMQAHLEETISQRKRLEACIERRGISTSGVKDVSAKFTAMMQNLGGVFAGDEVVKGVLASYAFEAMEIASYRILAEAAMAEGDFETAQLCKEICQEEEAMADWLKEHMPRITTAFLGHAASENADAKR